MWPLKRGAGRCVVTPERGVAIPDWSSLPHTLARAWNPASVKCAHPATSMFLKIEERLRVTKNSILCPTFLPGIALSVIPASYRQVMSAAIGMYRSVTRTHMGTHTDMLAHTTATRSTRLENTRSGLFHPTPLPPSPLHKLEAMSSLC